MSPAGRRVEAECGHAVAPASAPTQAHHEARPREDLWPRSRRFRDGSSLRAVKENQREGPRSAIPRRRTRPFEVSVRLRRRKPLPPLIPGPHRHMTHAEYAANHGADDAEIKKVEEFARHFNLDVQASLPVERTVLLKGNAADFSRAFGVELRTHRLPNGHTYRGRVGKISIPAELEGMVMGVFGLDNRRVAWPHVRFSRLPSPPASATAQATRGASAKPAAQFQTAGPIQAFYANQLAKSYNFPTDVDGAGQTIGIVELGGGFRQTDLATYFKQAGVKNPPKSR